MMLVWLVVGILTAHIIDAERIAIPTSLGVVIGSVKEEEGHRIEEYLGMPFAKPPVNDLRFQSPVPPDPWSEPYYADTFSAPCIQIVGFHGETPDLEISLGEKSPSEDCLYLNVWTPASYDGKLRPVLVWIHGGGWVQGAASQGVYHGSVLAALNDVVVVSVNYRLGIFGFLYSGSASAPGNVGLLDQRQALMWVKNNIKVFGGDPDQVTIIGESAGSMAVNFQVLSPLSKGLFKRAIMMSGSTYASSVSESKQKSLLRGNNVARVLGCASAEESLGSHPYKVLQCLKQKSADELLLISTDLALPSVFAFKPIFTEYFWPKPPILSVDGEFRNVDLLAGTTSQEAITIFILKHPEFLGFNLDNFTQEELYKNSLSVMEEYDVEVINEAINFYIKNVGSKLELCTELMNYVSDIGFTCPTNYFADWYSEKGNNIFTYRFSQLQENSWIPESAGVPHSFDIPFLFGRPFAVKERYTDRDRQFSRQVMQAFLSFARTGVPKLPSGEEWPKYSRKNQAYVDIKFGNMSLEKDLRKEKCDYLRKFTSF